MIDILNSIDSDITIWLNGIHSPFWDCFMSSFSGKVIWIPMYAAAAYLILKNFSWKVACCFLIAIALIIALTDMTCARAIRPFVERLRPANLNNQISDFIHIVDNYRGGKYGFPSCHSANSFALVTFLMLITRNKLVIISAIIWAVLNSYSRIYLGVHYFGDIIVGAVIGSLIAYFVTTQAQRAATKRLGYIHKDFKQTYVFSAVEYATILGIIIYSAAKVW